MGVTKYQAFSTHPKTLELTHTPQEGMYLSTIHCTVRFPKPQSLCYYQLSIRALQQHPPCASLRHSAPIKLQHPTSCPVLCISKRAPCLGHSQHNIMMLKTWHRQAFYWCKCGTNLQGPLRRLPWVITTSPIYRVPLYINHMRYQPYI